MVEWQASAETREQGTVAELTPQWLQLPSRVRSGELGPQLLTERKGLSLQAP